MERPVMNPSFHGESPAAPRPSWGARAWAGCRWIGRALLRVLLFDLVVIRRRTPLVIEDAHPLARLFHIALYRLLFVPVLLVLLVMALVYLGTHPDPVPAVVDPVAQGVYYDPITFSSQDNTRLEAWLVPIVDAKLVLEEKEMALQDKRPAVILVHDYGSSRQQMLPLMRPLHDAGFVVLAITLRGCGDSGPAATTFGINEAQDVEAAAQMLRRRPFVDADRIGLVGIGTGATACVLAAARDGGLRALVLDRPVHRFEDLLADRVGPRQPWLRWIDPLCKWSFQIAYSVDADMISTDHLSRDLMARSVLMFDEDGVSCLQTRKIGQVVDFLQKELAPPPPVAGHPSAATPEKPDKPVEDPQASPRILLFRSQKASN